MQPLEYKYQPYHMKTTDLCDLVSGISEYSTTGPEILRFYDEYITSPEKEPEEVDKRWIKDKPCPSCQGVGMAHEMGIREFEQARDVIHAFEGRTADEIKRIIDFINVYREHSDDMGNWQMMEDAHEFFVYMVDMRANSPGKFEKALKGWLKVYDKDEDEDEGRKLIFR